MSSMFCTKIYNCKNADWCARDFNPKSENPKCFEQLTHYDRVHAMNEEELARFISSLVGCPLNKLEECPKGKCTKKCKASECWLAWLRKEVKNEAHKD